METTASSASEPFNSNIGGQSTDVVFEDERSEDDGVSSVPSHLGEGEPGNLDTPPCINIMFICGEWGSKNGGLSTFNRELAVNLAKTSNDKIKVHCYVSESSEAERLDAIGKGVNLITAGRSPGSSDPLDWLKTPPSDLLNPDIVVAHGRKFGGAAYFIQRITNCRWIHFVHVYCEALGKYKLESGVTADAIADNEEKNRRELELCKASDLVVAVGSLLQRKYQRCLPNIKVEAITPGIFELYVNPTARQSEKFESSQEEFCIFMFGRGSFEDFELKGYDIIGKAVALLERKFELTFVGAARDEQRKVEKWFLEETKISREQLTIRGFCSYVEMVRMLQEADLVVMPSRTEGFGLVSLETISAGVPVLVSSESGLAKALQDVEGGMSVVVKSHAPDDWANRIRQLSEQKSESRHTAALQLREQYNLKYPWQGECEKIEKMIIDLVERTQIDLPLNHHLTGNTTTEDVLKAVITMDGKEVPKSEYLQRPINADPIICDKSGEQEERSKKEVQSVIDSSCSPKPAVQANGSIQGVQIADKVFCNQSSSCPQPSTSVNSRENRFGGGIMEIVSYPSKCDRELQEERLCGSGPDSRGKCTEEGATVLERSKLLRFMSWPSDPLPKDRDLFECNQAAKSYKRSNSHEPKSKSKDVNKFSWKRVAKFFSPKRHKRSCDPFNNDGNSGESSLDNSMVTSPTGSDSHVEPDQNSTKYLSPLKEKDTQRLSISGSVCSGESVASPTAALKRHKISYEQSNGKENSGESSLDKSMVIPSSGSDSQDEPDQNSTEYLFPFKEKDEQRLSFSGSVCSGESVASPKAAGYESRYRLLEEVPTSSGKTISIIHCSHMEKKAFEDEVLKLFYHFSENLAYECHLDKLEMVKVAENKLRWAMESVQQSDFLFICVSPELKRIFDLPPEEISTSLEDDHACMVRLESDLILADLTMKGCNKNGKYMPILLKGSSRNDVPCFLANSLKYCWPDEERKIMCIIEGQPENVSDRPSQ